MSCETDAGMTFMDFAAPTVTEPLTWDDEWALVDDSEYGADAVLARSLASRAVGASSVGRDTFLADGCVAPLAHDVRRRRKALGLSQADLAGRAGVSATTLSRIEMDQGRVRVDTMRRVASALGCSVEALVYARLAP